MKRVIITGGTGFVGANLARRLLYEGHEVHLLLRPNHTAWRIQAVQADVHLHEVRLENPDDARQVVKSIQPEWIFHLAAHGAYSWQTDFPQMVQTNFMSTVNLVEACLKTGFEVFVNTGSSSEYGFKDHAPSESEAPEPNSYYAVTKASATLYCGHIARSHNIRIPTLRLYSVYGPYEEPSRLMPTLIVHGLKGRLPPLVSPHIARDYIYVDDVLDAYLLAVGDKWDAPDAIYNVGTGVQTTIEEIVKIAQRVLNITAAPEWGSMSDRTWDTSVWIADARSIYQQLGWLPHNKVEQGFQKFVDWLNTNNEMHAFYMKTLVN
jgi:nucleoside-diphosphate-sugar epimerase